MSSFTSPARAPRATPVAPNAPMRHGRRPSDERVHSRILMKPLPSIHDEDGALRFALGHSVEGKPMTLAGGLGFTNFYDADIRRVFNQANEQHGRTWCVLDRLGQQD